MSRSFVIPRHCDEIMICVIPKVFTCHTINDFTFTLYFEQRALIENLCLDDMLAILNKYSHQPKSLQILWHRKYSTEIEEKFVAMLMSCGIEMDDIKHVFGLSLEYYQKNFWKSPRILPKPLEEGDVYETINTFRHFSMLMTDESRTILEEDIRYNHQLVITADTINIYYLQDFNFKLLLPENIEDEEILPTYIYCLTIDSDFYGKFEYFGMQSILNAFELNAREIVFDSTNMLIDGNCRFTRFIQDFHRLRSKIKYKCAIIRLAGSLYYEMKRRMEFISVLHCINFSDYLNEKDVGCLFSAYDDLIENCQMGSMLLNRNEIIQVDYKDEIEKYSYDVTIFKTVLKSVSFDGLKRIFINCAKFGKIIFDYSKLRLRTRADRERLAANYYALKVDIITKTRLQPLDFYEMRMRQNLLIIMNQIRLGQYLDTSGIINYYMAFCDLMASYCIDKKSVLWNCKNKMPLRDVMIEFQTSTIQIYGNDNFSFTISDKNKQLMDILLKFFYYFGSLIHNITLQINSWFIFGESAIEQKQCFLELHRMITTYCTSIQTTEVTCFEEIPNIEPSITKINKLYTDLQYFSAESDLVDEINHNKTSIKNAVLTRNALAITTTTFEMILKLQNLVTLELNMPYPLLPDWTFLENIRFGSKLKVLPHLKNLLLINQEDGNTYAIEGFLKNISQFINFPLDSLVLRNWHLCLASFRECLIQPRHVEFICCTIEENVKMMKLPCFSHTIELAFQDMMVPISFMGDETTDTDIKLLNFINCQNVTNDGLELILKLNTKLEYLHIDCCPISDAFFYNLLNTRLLGSKKKRYFSFEHLNGCLNIAPEFNMVNVPECSPRILDIIHGFYDRYKVSYHNTYPKMEITDNFIEIVHDPEIEKLYTPNERRNYTAYEEIFGSTINKNNFEKLNRQYSQYLEEVIIRREWNHIYIIGSSNEFVVSVSLELPEVQKKLLKFFQCFGRNIIKIRILIVNSSRPHYGVNCRISEPSLALLIRLIRKYCADSVEIEWADDAPKYENRAVSNRRSVEYDELNEDYFTLQLRGCTCTYHLIAELEVKQHALSEIFFTEFDEGMSEESFKLILTLPWLRSLHFSASFPNIKCWKFLAHITTESKLIFPRLQYLGFTQYGKECNVAKIECFLENLHKLINHPMEIATLTFQKCNKLTSEFFEKCWLKPEYLTFQECTLDDDVDIKTFSIFTNVKHLGFINMGVPDVFWKPTTTQERRKLYLQLAEYKGDMSKVLDQMWTENSFIKELDCDSNPYGDDSAQSKSMTPRFLHSVA